MHLGAMLAHALNLPGPATRALSPLSGLLLPREGRLLAWLRVYLVSVVPWASLGASSQKEPRSDFVP